MFDLIRRLLGIDHVLTESPPLTFDNFQRANCLRASSIHNSADDWGPMQWGCALAGEAGELCNFLKKWERDGPSVELRESIGKEIADVICYADLIATKFGLRTSALVHEKWNEISYRQNVSSMHLLPYSYDCDISSLGKFVPTGHGDDVWFAVPKYRVW